MKKIVSLYPGKTTKIQDRKVTSTAKSCRRCGEDLSRIRRNKLFKAVFFWFPVRRYICYGCRKKTWRLFM